jgi:hypothetical protein
MATQEKINEQLHRIGLGDLTAYRLIDFVDAWVLVEDTQEVTAFVSAEGCWRALSLLPNDSKVDDVFYALQPNYLDVDVLWEPEIQCYRQDPQATTGGD